MDPELRDTIITKMVKNGCSKANIGRRLGLAANTVHSHITRLGLKSERAGRESHDYAIGTKTFNRGKKHVQRTQKAAAPGLRDAGPGDDADRPDV